METMSKKKKSEAWSKTRNFFNDIHLWIGLSSGILVFLICLSGTIYVFNTELKEFSSSHLYQVNATGKALSPELLITKVEAESQGKVVSLRIADDRSRSWQFSVRKKEKTPEGGTVTLKYFINPYNGNILGSSADPKTNLDKFMGYMFSLHRWLLLDKIEKPIFGELENRKLGSYISGISTILFTLGVITGMVIWVPRKVKSWRQGLKVKWNASWKRINHDLHNSLGLYACVFLFLMGITGPQWSFGWYREGLRKSLGVYKPADAPKETELQSILPNANLVKLKILDYTESADEQLSYKGDYTITLPSDSLATIKISKHKLGFFAPVASDKLQMDQYSGVILKKEIFSELPLNERIGGSIKALHIGDVYGSFTKIIYFLACLIATSLPITGTMIWINKMKRKTKKEPQM